MLGDSAGGNLSAGTALRARDAGTPILAQFLIYPAFDERTGGPDAPVDNRYAGEFVLTRQYIHQLWKARLAGVATDKLPYLAPRRIEDLAGSPPTFIAVGSIDVLVDEVVRFAARASATEPEGVLAGLSCERRHGAGDRAAGLHPGAGPRGPTIPAQSTWSPACSARNSAAAPPRSPPAARLTWSCAWERCSARMALVRPNVGVRRPLDISKSERLLGWWSRPAAESLVDGGAKPAGARPRGGDRPALG